LTSLPNLGVSEKVRPQARHLPRWMPFVTSFLGVSSLWQRGQPLFIS
jgi:hypothetical protein